MALANTSQRLKWAPRTVGIGAVAIYRAAISPAIHAMNGPACRFEPSCSEYARHAIAEYGVVRGGAMAIWRIARCNPVGGHGWDPVPSRTDAPFLCHSERSEETRSGAGRSTVVGVAESKRGGILNRALRALYSDPHLHPLPNRERRQKRN